MSDDLKPDLTEWAKHPDGFLGRETYIREDASNPEDIVLMVRGKLSQWAAYVFTPDLGGGE